jgi:hypothetical protein
VERPDSVEMSAWGVASLAGLQVSLPSTFSFFSESHPFTWITFPLVLNGLSIFRPNKFKHAKMAFSVLKGHGHKMVVEIRLE